MLISLLFTNPDHYFIILVLVIFSICLHEYFHAQMAVLQGDYTAANQGHLTLNPLKQMGIISLVLCSVIGIAFGAVPVTPSNFRKKYSHALVSFAGPLANMLLFFIFVIIASVLKHFNAPFRTYVVFEYGSILNVALFLFNMMPIPPLDGAEILAYFFPQVHDIRPEIKNNLYIFLFIFLFIFFHVFFSIGEVLTGGVIFVIGKILSHLL